MTNELKTIHPFPARMAPDTLSHWIDALPTDSTVLDPMCGSGVVLRQALMAGHRSIGLDLDPLAVLMSSVWTKRISVRGIIDDAKSLCHYAQSLKLKNVFLPWMDNCKETTRFTKYWFAPAQRNALRRIAYSLVQTSKMRPRGSNDMLWLALSRTIITKQAGASLAWDVSHSRPHKVDSENDFDVYLGFVRAVERCYHILSEQNLPRSGKIYLGDSRHMNQIRSDSIDAIFSSPPYLNAIDYLRGHKFSLVWMGYTIPDLRHVRSISVGAERAPDERSLLDFWTAVQRRVPGVRALPLRQQHIVERYVYDSARLLHEFRRVLKPDGQMGLVLGDSSVRGQYIENSKIYRLLAKKLGFEKLVEKRRAIETNKRYLPIISKNKSLGNRMRHEIIQIYRLTN